MFTNPINGRDPLMEKIDAIFNRYDEAEQNLGFIFVGHHGRDAKIVRLDELDETGNRTRTDSEFADEVRATLDQQYLAHPFWVSFIKEGKKFGSGGEAEAERHSKFMDYRFALAEKLANSASIGFAGMRFNAEGDGFYEKLSSITFMFKTQADFDKFTEEHIGVDYRRHPELGVKAIKPKR